MQPTSSDEITNAFRIFDTDGDGLLSLAELQAVLCRPTPDSTPWTEQQVDELMQRFDTNNDGVLSIEEFVKAWKEVQISKAAGKALQAAVQAYGIAPGPPEAQALILAQKGLWPETWDGGETWHEEGNKEKALPAALVEAELAAKAAVEAQNLEKFGTTAPNSDAAAKYSHASWVEVPSALPEDTAPSARLGAQGSARSYCRTQSAA